MTDPAAINPDQHADHPRHGLYAGICVGAVLMAQYTHLLAILPNPRMLLAIEDSTDTAELRRALLGLLRKDETAEVYRCRLTDDPPEISELVWDASDPNGFPLPKNRAFAAGEKLCEITYEQVERACAGLP